MSQIDFMEIFNNQVSGEIRKATDLLLNLEKNPKDADILHNLMRIFHSIKGAARAVNLNEIKNITHRLEDLFQAINEEKITYHKSLINLSFDAIDLIKTMVDDNKQGKKITEATNFYSQIDSFLAGEHDQPKKIQPEPTEENDSYELEKEETETQEDIASEEQEEISATSFEQDQQEKTKAEYKQTVFKTNSDMSDILMNLIGELTVSIVSLEDQRQSMRHILTRLIQLQSDLGKFLETNSQNNEFATQIINHFRSLCQEQTQNIESLDNTENRLKFLTSEIDRQVTQSRLIELDEIFSDYPRMIRDLSCELKKKCSIEITGQTTRIDRGVLEMVRTPIMHILRNAIDHGIESQNDRKKCGKPETGKIKIHAERKGSQIIISISDDGCGINETRLKQKIVERGDTTIELFEKMSTHEKNQFLFLPGFTTTSKISETSGRGVGLDVVKTEVEKMGGRVFLENYSGKGLTVKLELPITLSLTPCVLVKGGQDSFFGVQHYAFPENEIDEIRIIKKEEQCTIEGRDAIRIKNETIMIYDFCSLMNLNHVQKNFEKKRMFILNAGSYRIGLIVDNIYDEQHIVMRSLDERLGKIPNIEGITLLSDGNVALIVDIKDILQNVSSSEYMQLIPDITEMKQTAKKDHILVVEDSQTVREVERHFLESAGYAVTTAVNGVDGLNKLKSGHFDLIISDIDMPRMNGIEMIHQIRMDKRYAELPVIVVSYKDREADRQKALEVGVNLYVTKSEFDSASMLERIKNLL